MKSAYDVIEKEKKRTRPEREHNIPSGLNPAKQIAYVNARLDKAQRQFDEQRDGYWDCLMLTFLWFLHTQPDIAYGPKRLERAYRQMVEDRARMRADYRSWDPDKFGREIPDVADPGKHVEDRGYKEQLRAIGFDYDAMEERAYWIDEKKGIIGWRDAKKD